MTYAIYYKILHGRKKYNVKFLADYLSMYFPLCAIDFDDKSDIFYLDRDYLISLNESELNLLSKAISKHSYYDAFVNDKLVLTPLFPLNRTK